jgi:hypothetical protein
MQAQRQIPAPGFGTGTPGRPEHQHVNVGEEQIARATSAATTTWQTGAADGPPGEVTLTAESPKLSVTGTLIDAVDSARCRARSTSSSNGTASTTCRGTRGRSRSELIMQVKLGGDGAQRRGRHPALERMMERPEGRDAPPDVKVTGPVPHAVADVADHQRHRGPRPHRLRAARPGGTCHVRQRDHSDPARHRDRARRLLASSTEEGEGDRRDHEGPGRRGGPLRRRAALLPQQSASRSRSARRTRSKEPDAARHPLKQGQTLRMP